MRVLDLATIVAEKVPLSGPTIKDKVAKGEFPKPIELTKFRLGWLESEVDEWIAARAAERDLANAPRPVAPGRQKFWADVKAGLRPHPRTAGKAKREQRNRAAQ